MRNTLFDELDKQASIDLRRALRRLRPHSHWHGCSDWHHQDDLRVAEVPLPWAATGAERACFFAA